MTILAFDYGTKRIGVAIGNTITNQSRALVVIENRDRNMRFEAIANLIQQWQPKHLIVGLPTYLDGKPHEMTQLAKRFGQQLNGRFNLPVSWVDERLTTQMAIENLRINKIKKLRVDAEAACIILQQYLDEQSGQF